MSRKRSAVSIIDDSNNEESSFSSQSQRDRSVFSIINEASVSPARPSHNTKKREVCNYPNCNGKLVDSHTKEIHDSRQNEYQDSQESISG